MDSFKKIIFLLFFVSISCNQKPSDRINYNQTKSNQNLTVSDVDSNKKPNMVFENKIWDFGEIVQGESVTHSFIFKNEGDAPLIISNAKGSCGCTVPEWPRFPISPGDSNSIKVIFNSKGKKGLQNKSVTLTSNMTPNSTVLKVKGFVNFN